MAWQPLIPGQPTKNGVPVDIAQEEMWINDQYVVLKSTIESDRDGIPPMIHLSIRNQDRSVKHDWRDFQRIKNQLAGPQWEAVEIYPAEERKVDGANQYHLWCFDFQLHFGFSERVVTNSYQTEILTPGAVQRDQEPIDLAYGGLTKMREAKALFRKGDEGYGEPLTAEEES